jgi:hypothetical protein
VYTCPSHMPFTLAGQRYAFGAANFVECCECLELLFADDTPLAGETLIVQVTNRGDDLGAKHVDVGMPGGGFGIFNGCAVPSDGGSIAQFPSSSASAWGARYGGLSSVDGCANLPSALHAGCEWRFATDGYRNADNPPAYWRRVLCPAVLTNLSGCSYDAPGVVVAVDGDTTTSSATTAGDATVAPGDTDEADGSRSAPSPASATPLPIIGALATVAVVACHSLYD